VSKLDPDTLKYCPFLPLTAPFCPSLSLTAPSCLIMPLTAPTSRTPSQTKLSAFWPGRKWPPAQHGETSSPAVTPTMSSTPKPSGSRKRLRDRVVSAAVVDAANALTWHVDGVAVPVGPPSREISTSNALLSSHIVAHNSFVSARAAQDLARETTKATTCAPAAKRRRGINPSADASGADPPGSGIGEEPLVTVIPSS